MEPKIIKVGIVGVSGYSGRELLRFLLDHPGAEVVYVSANTTVGKVSDMWPEFAGRTDLVCEPYQAAEAAKADLIFLATPHTVSMRLAPELIEKGVKVIDISGDFRLSSPEEYAKWYKTSDHAAPHLLQVYVSLLPEIYGDQIICISVIANRSCHPAGSSIAVSALAKLN